MVNHEECLFEASEMKQTNSNLARINHFYLIIAACLLWLLSFHEGLITAYDVWVVSEIYNHCLLVLPIVAYLIYEKRDQLKQTEIKPTRLLLIPISGLLAIQLFAQIGDIKIIMHLATFTALPLIVWTVLGHNATRVIAFPLFFTVFAIPIGDQLVPYLQELTTDVAVPILNLAGVPVFRNGLYLDIPEGRFLVAEACSGISFLITSVVFGFLYSYLFFTTTKKRVVFIVVATLVPIAANALRVFGIIFTAHITDMEHAVGADHLIYGGVFYAIILFILIIIGEWYRDPIKKNEEQPVQSENLAAPFNTRKGVVALVPLLVLVLIQQAWLSSATVGERLTLNQYQKLHYQTQQLSDEIILKSKASNGWAPIYDEQLLQNNVTLEVDSKEVNAFVAYYDGQKGRLISSSHRLYDQQSWSLISQGTQYIKGNAFSWSHIISPTGKKKHLLHWSQVGGKRFTSEGKARLYQAWLKTTQTSSAGLTFILFLDDHMLAELKLNSLNELENRLVTSLLDNNQ